MPHTRQCLVIIVYCSLSSGGFDFIFFKGLSEKNRDKYKIVKWNYVRCLRAKYSRNQNLQPIYTA